MLNSFRSVWRQEEFGDLLRRSFSSNALLKRTTKTEMWIYITGLRRSLSRRGVIQSRQVERARPHLGREELAGWLPFSRGRRRAFFDAAKNIDFA